MQRKLNDKILVWLKPDSIEEAAKQQLHNISKLPFIFKHIAAMPDCHLGKGATVGSVIATKGAIIPAAVGVDIGCGMIAVQTKFFAKDLPDSLEKLRHSIERSIPLGVGKVNQKLTESAESRRLELIDQATNDYSMLARQWPFQLGTLGSGNHFIELSLDENNKIWVVLHSGSRGIGNLIAQKHIKIAQKLMDNMFISLDDRDLAYLPEAMPQFRDYIKDLLWAQKFALLNREEMMDRVMKDLSFFFFKENGHQAEIEIERINCHHNFTQQENHFGQNVWVTRKGAIQMRKSQRGVIPGSMGTKSYIVSGLGNPLSFCSAPHGAGRRMSRNEAREIFSLEDLEKAMEGIE
ncbi:MAG: RtcB family protein, partial [Patescibacteria group bacterium]